MVNSQLVSVIIPVYNVEKYLKKCVDSIINQTYQNLEIFLVDDGSTDNSSKICDEYEKVDSRIKALHKENGGQGSARNVALNFAKGEYVLFVDSDDWISENWIESLVNSIIKNKSSISVGGMCCCTDVRQVYVPVSNDIEFIESPNQMIKYITEADIKSAVANKLYSRNLFENIRFPEGIIYEDAYAIFEVLGECNRVSFTNEGCYFYRIRSGSTTHKQFSKKNLDLLYVSDNMVKYYRENYPHLEKLAVAHSINEVMTILMAMFTSEKPENNSDFERILNKAVKEKIECYNKLNGETYNYSISDDAYMYLNDRKKYIKKCNKIKRNIILKQLVIKIISIFKKQNY